MRLPKWVISWLEDVGIATDDFLRVFEAAAEKIDAPAELVDTVSTWVQENVKVKLVPEVVLGFVALVVSEVKSGKPGYRADHGGLL